MARHLSGWCYKSTFRCFLSIVNVLVEIVMTYQKNIVYLSESYWIVCYSISICHHRKIGHKLSLCLRNTPFRAKANRYNSLLVCKAVTMTSAYCTRGWRQVNVLSRGNPITSCWRANSQGPLQLCTVLGNTGNPRVPFRYKNLLSMYRIAIIKIRRSRDQFIVMMGFIYRSDEQVLS